MFLLISALFVLMSAVFALMSVLSVLMLVLRVLMSAVFLLTNDSIPSSLSMISPSWSSYRAYNFTAYETVGTKSASVPKVANTFI